MLQLQCCAGSHVFSGSLYVMIAIYFIFPFKEMIWWLIVVWDWKLPEGNHSILPHCQITLILLSVVLHGSRIWHECDLLLSEGCEEIADCPIAVTAYNSVLFFTGPKAPLSTVQLVNECLQQLVIFMHHLYHAAFLLDYLIFISAWFGSSRSQTNTEKLCMLLNVLNTHLRRIHVSFGGWQNENWCDEPQVF